MGVNFSPFEIGRRALRASQMGLSVTGQNIANVNTPGYSRQAVQLSASPANGSSNLGLVGNGVSIDGVRDFRDRFVESRLQTETGISGRLTAQRDALLPVDGVFNEADGTGISAAINNFFGSFTALEANPNSLPLRADIVAKTDSMTAAFGKTRRRLVTILGDTDSGIRATVTQVNELTQRVAELNTSISVTEHSGLNASELRDQRGEIVRQLSELTGARALENSDGSVTLTLSDGQALVSGDHVNLLDVTTTATGFTRVLLNGQDAALTDGRLKGLQDAETAIIGQITSLDDLAASIAARVNALHTSGTDLNGNPGGVFFTVPASGPITAANISVAAAIRTNPRLIVASQLATPSTFATVAGAIGALLTDPSSTAGSKTGSFSSIYASIVSDAGHNLQSVQDALATQQAILSQTTAQRDAMSGVSLDEEAINLLRFQKSYEAAARFLKIADEMTQTIMSLAG